MLRCSRHRLLSRKSSLLLLSAQPASSGAPQNQSSAPTQEEHQNESIGHQTKSTSASATSQASAAAVHTQTQSSPSSPSAHSNNGQTVVVNAATGKRHVLTQKGAHPDTGGGNSNDINKVSKEEAKGAASASFSQRGVGGGGRASGVGGAIGRHHPNGYADVAHNGGAHSGTVHPPITVTAAADAIYSSYPQHSPYNPSYNGAYPSAHFPSSSYNNSNNSDSNYYNYYYNGYPTPSQQQQQYQYQQYQQQQQQQPSYYYNNSNSAPDFSAPSYGYEQHQSSPQQYYQHQQQAYANYYGQNYSPQYNQQPTVSPAVTALLGQSPMMGQSAPPSAAAAASFSYAHPSYTSSSSPSSSASSTYSKGVRSLLYSPQQQQQQVQSQQYNRSAALFLPLPPQNKGLYIVPERQAWVVERRGKFHKVIATPGTHLLVPYLDVVRYVVNTSPLTVPLQGHHPEDPTALSDVITVTTADGAVYEVSGLLHLVVPMGGSTSSSSGAAVAYPTPSPAAVSSTSSSASASPSSQAQEGTETTTPPSGTVDSASPATPPNNSSNSVNPDTNANANASEEGNVKASSSSPSVHSSPPSSFSTLDASSAGMSLFNSAVSAATRFTERMRRAAAEIKKEVEKEKAREAAKARGEVVREDTTEETQTPAASATTTNSSAAAVPSAFAFNSPYSPYSPHSSPYAVMQRNTKASGRTVVPPHPSFIVPPSRSSLLNNTNTVSSNNGSAANSSGTVAAASAFVRGTSLWFPSSSGASSSCIQSICYTSVPDPVAYVNDLFGRLVALLASDLTEAELLRELENRWVHLGDVDGVIERELDVLDAARSGGVTSSNDLDGSKATHTNTAPLTAETPATTTATAETKNTFTTTGTTSNSDASNATSSASSNDSTHTNSDTSDKPVSTNSSDVGGSNGKTKAAPHAMVFTSLLALRAATVLNGALGGNLLAVTECDINAVCKMSATEFQQRVAETERYNTQLSEYYASYKALREGGRYGSGAVGDQHHHQEEASNLANNNNVTEQHTNEHQEDFGTYLPSELERERLFENIKLQSEAQLLWAEGIGKSIGVIAKAIEPNGEAGVRAAEFLGRVGGGIGGAVSQTAGCPPAK